MHCQNISHSGRWHSVQREKSLANRRRRVFSLAPPLVYLLHKARASHSRPLREQATRPPRLLPNSSQISIMARSGKELRKDNQLTAVPSGYKYPPGIPFSLSARLCSRVNPDTQSDDHDLKMTFGALQSQATFEVCSTRGRARMFADRTELVRMRSTTRRKTRLATASGCGTSRHSSPLTGHAFDSPSTVIRQTARKS